MTRSVMLWTTIALLLALQSARPSAQPNPGRNQGNVCDISGEWSARFNEDWEERQLLGANLGDYTGIPLNDAGRLFSRTWDASMLSLPTQQTLPHSAHWFMRGPGPNFRAAKFTNPVDGEVLGYTIAGFGDGPIARSGPMDVRTRRNAPSTHGPVSRRGCATAASSP